MDESLFNIDAITPEETTIVKTEKGMVEIKPSFVPTPPDFVCDEQKVVCAWIDKRNTEGEIITLNLHIGEFRYRLRKRFF